MNKFIFLLNNHNLPGSLYALIQFSNGVAQQWLNDERSYFGLHK